MTSLDVRIKPTDAVRVVIRSIALPFVLAVGLIAYRGNLDLEGIGLLAGLMIAVIAVASLIMVATPAMTLTEQGINVNLAPLK